MCSWFGLFDPVALHGLSLFIEAQKPCPARLLLSVEHRAVDHVVVLKHRLLKLTLCCKQFLRRKTDRDKKKYWLYYLTVAANVLRSFVLKMCVFKPSAIHLFIVPL